MLQSTYLILRVVIDDDLMLLDQENLNVGGMMRFGFVRLLGIVGRVSTRYGEN